MKRYFIGLVVVVLMVFAGCQYLEQSNAAQEQQCSSCQGSSVEQIVKSGNYVLVDDNFSYDGVRGKLYQNKKTGERIVIVSSLPKKIEYDGTLYCDDHTVNCGEGTGKNCTVVKIDGVPTLLTAPGTKCIGE